MSKDDFTNIEDDFVDINEYNLTPFLINWKSTLKMKKKYIQKHYDKKEQSLILSKLNDFVETLIIEGNATEDVVIKTGIVFYTTKLTGCNVVVAFPKLSVPVHEGLEILLNNPDKVFSNLKYSYLNKIKITECITELKYSVKKSEDIKLLAEVDKIIKKYKNFSNKNLMSLLIENRKI